MLFNYTEFGKWWENKKIFLNENQIFYWILKNLKILIYIYILIK